MSKTFMVNLKAIQPSQLYINSAKLATVRASIDPSDPSSYGAVPLKRLGDGLIYTDGHTRALTVHLNGLNNIKACWENEDLNWRMYQVCVA